MRMLVKLFAFFTIVLVCYPVAGSELTTAPTTTKYTLTALSPTQAVVGSGEFVLTLTGTSFKRSAQVMFGSTQLATTYVDTKTIRAGVPASELATARLVSVNVVNLDTKGGATNALTFYVVNPVPAISAITPSSLTVSGLPKKVTILGSGFVDGVKVNVGAGGIEQIDPSSVLPEAIGVEIPGSFLENPGSVPISVTNPEPGGGPSNVVMLMVRGKAVTAWQTVVNNQTPIPGHEARKFNSYNQPSVNQSGLVVFKGQSKSGSGSTVEIADSGPTVGIYVRDMNGGQPIAMITDNSTAVPAPNNLDATFIQFPSFPRIDMNSATVAFRGQSQPVYSYTLSDGSDTRIGTTGIFSNPAGPLATGVSLLGIVPGYEYFQVPGTTTLTRFDQFPGSPAVTSNSTVVFKGNYTEGTLGKTGVFYRDLASTDPEAPVELIANSDTLIPNQPEGGAVVFGSTAPPSAASGTAVFVGLDNEDNPSMGGVYEAPLAQSPTLTTLVGIGSQVPGERDGVTFNRLGEGLSFDGRYVAFWGAWGANTKLRVLQCATDGNKDVIAACNAMYPNGYKAKIPVNQGIFVYDREEGTLIPVAKTPGEFDDFVYWVFSGRPPVAGQTDEGGEAEPPRWRSSSFIAVAGQDGDAFAMTFKAMIGSVDGIYLAQGPDAAPILTVLDTYMPGQEIDPAAAPEGSSIVTVGMERDGLRGDWLVVTSSMLNETTTLSNAGVYVTPFKQ
ncbi:MAG: hypothetical protein KGM96_08480 [Acidobacteriota bacterium]|nr:hypothetical protein [Acidobacteriota bacterium]